MYNNKIGLRSSLIIYSLISAFFLLSCTLPTQQTLSKDEISKICLDEKKKATFPEAEVNLTKSKKGSSVGFSLSFGSSFLKGIDPETVYSNCVNQYY